MKKIFFKSTHNLKLSGVVHSPIYQTNKAIILAHGLTTDKDESGAFIRLAEFLKDNGFTVLRFDFRGHGESEGKSINFTLEGEIADLEVAVNEVRKQGFTKIGLLGASFGGGIATLYTVKHQSLLACLVLWNPCLNFNHTLINPYLPWIVNKKDQMKNDLKQKGWTSVGSNHFVLGKELFHEMGKTYPYKKLKQISIPTVIIHGNKDTYVPYEDSKDYVKNLRNGKLITLSGGEHGFHTSKYEKLANQATLVFFKKYLI